MLPGITKRIEKELKEKYPDSMNVKVIDQPERKYMVWIGGSVMEYDDYGVSIVHRKCF